MGNQIPYGHGPSPITPVRHRDGDLAVPGDGRSPRRGRVTVVRPYTKGVVLFGGRADLGGRGRIVDRNLHQPGALDVGRLEPPGLPGGPAGVDVALEGGRELGRDDL